MDTINFSFIFQLWKWVGYTVVPWRYTAKRNFVVPISLLNSSQIPETYHFSSENSWSHQIREMYQKLCTFFAWSRTSELNACVSRNAGYFVQFSVNKINRNQEKWKKEGRSRSRVRHIAITNWCLYSFPLLCSSARESRFIFIENETIDQSCHCSIDGTASARDTKFWILRQNSINNF